jgi:head-tail adaptor
VIQPRLDRQICLYKATQSLDTASAPVTTWSEQFQLWCGREQVSANEQQSVFATRGTQIDRLRVRYLACLEDPDALQNYRVHMNGRYYDLVSAVEDLRYGRREWMLLTLAYTQGEPTLTTATVPVIA